MKYKVSVILPVYNGEKTLAKTLDSLVKQTYQDFELVVCIDGSKDTSSQIILDFKDKFKQTTILINENNLGLGPTMNRLLANAQGEYIAVAEQDDFYYATRLQLQVALLDAKPQIGLVSGIADFWDGNSITSRFPGILINGNQYPQNTEMFLLNYKHHTKVVNSCMMFRKSVHVANGLYFSKHYPNVPVDLAYFLRFCLVSDIHGIPQSLVLLDRRMDRSSVTSNKIKQFSATKELIRSFKYEYPKIISHKDFKFAMTTLHLLELSEYNKYKFPFYFFKFYSANYYDKRWKSYLLKRLQSFLK